MTVSCPSFFGQAAVPDASFFLSWFLSFFLSGSLRFQAIRLVTEALLSRFIPAQPSSFSLDRFALKRRGNSVIDSREKLLRLSKKEEHVGKKGRKRTNHDEHYHNGTRRLTDGYPQSEGRRDRVYIQLIFAVGNNDLPVDYHIPERFNQWSADLYSLWKSILPPDEETKEVGRAEAKMRLGTLFPNRTHLIEIHATCREIER